MPATPVLIDQASSHNRITSAWLWLFGAVLVACSLIFLVMRRNWPMVGDAALLRYAVFLIRHGWTPYQDIVDINMPGAYWATAFGMNLAGSVDASWRVFDVGLIALTGLGYFAIARPYSRFAALFATAMLLLVHGQDGVQQAGQRDLVIAALLVVAVAFLLEAVRRDNCFYLVPFGLAVGLSATIKPTAAPLGLVLLVMATIYRTGLPEKTLDLRGVANQRVWLNWTLIGIAAMAVPLACMLLWLEYKHALDAWLAMERLGLPYYASQARRGFGFTLSHSISPLLALVLFWLLCAALRGPAWPRFERLLVATAAILSLAALLAQGKALPYQRYPMMAFLLPLIALDLTTAWTERGSRQSARSRQFARYVALGGLCCSCLILAPLALVKVHRFDAKPQEFDVMLTADLSGVHGGDLSGRIQCLDAIQECLPTLYSMHLLPATGTLSDQALFDTVKAPAVQILRQRFEKEVTARPPLVFVVVSGFSLDSVKGYQKLETWLAFERWLNANYTLTVERTPTHLVRWWGRAQQPAGYRLYVLKSGTAATEIPFR
jgi:dolichyl-phosphate-mannose-protein mannosyltransferase